MATYKKIYSVDLKLESRDIYFFSSHIRKKLNRRYIFYNLYLNTKYTELKTFLSLNFKKFKYNFEIYSAESEVNPTNLTPFIEAMSGIKLNSLDIKLFVSLKKEVLPKDVTLIFLTQEPNTTDFRVHINSQSGIVNLFRNDSIDTHYYGNYMFVVCKKMYNPTLLV